MQTLNELLESPLFTRLAGSIRLEQYGRDGGPRKVRRRIELRTGQLDAALLRQALHAQCECVHCGKPIYPFRPRVKGLGDRVQKPRHIYVAVACPLDVNVGCSRGKKSREAYLAIREVVEKAQQPPARELPAGWEWEFMPGVGWAARNIGTRMAVYLVDGELCVTSLGMPTNASLEIELRVPASVIKDVLLES